jgi:DNA repair photolyase
MAARPEFRWSSIGEDGATAGDGRLFSPVEREVGTGRYAGLEFLRVHARSIINRVPAGPMPFQYTINAYRGCSHACTYCFARPTHAYLGFDTGEDFDRRIVVKVNAAELARAELDPRRWAGHWVAMGTNTDPYQPAEGRFRLTRGVVEALADAGNPFSILTKSGLVLRDLDVLVAASHRARVRVDLSIGTLDPAVWRATEPGTPHPALRLRALRRLREAGIDAGVLVAPILPGISDRTEQMAAVIRAVVAAGATTVGTSILHLRPGVREHFMDRLAATHPELVDHYARTYRGTNPAGAVRADIERRFYGLVRDHGGDLGNRWRPESLVRPSPKEPAPARPCPVPEQLQLALPVPTGR